jgi:hypothetical protein
MSFEFLDYDQGKKEEPPRSVQAIRERAKRRARGGAPREEPTGIRRTEVLMPWVRFYGYREVLHRAPWGKTKEAWLRESIRVLNSRFGFRYQTEPELEEELRALWELHCAGASPQLILMAVEMESGSRPAQAGEEVGADG